MVEALPGTAAAAMLMQGLTQAFFRAASLNPTYTRGKRMDYGEERDVRGTDPRKHEPACMDAHAARCWQWPAHDVSILLCCTQEAHMQAVLQAQGLPATSPNRHSAGDRRTTSGRTISGRDIGPPGAQHGHKGNLLFRPLAPAPAEVQN